MWFFDTYLIRSKEQKILNVDYFMNFMLAVVC